MREYAAQQLGSRLRRLAMEARRTLKTPNEEAVHDLRVSIRRFSQALKLFADLLPAGEAKRMRKRLRPIMELAGEIRNRDIALELIAKAGLAADSGMLARFQLERREMAARLKRALGSWSRGGHAAKWMERLS